MQYLFGTEYPANLIIGIILLFAFSLEIIEFFLKNVFRRKEIRKIIAHTPLYTSIIKEYTLHQLQNSLEEIKAMKSREFDKGFKFILKLGRSELVKTLEKQSGISLKWDDVNYAEKRVLKDCIAFDLPLLETLRVLIEQSELHHRPLTDEDLKQLFNRFAVNGNSTVF